MTAKTTVTIAAVYPGSGDPLAFGRVVIRLHAGTAGGVVDGLAVVSETVVHLAADGTGSVALYPNTAVTPAESYYSFTVDNVVPVAVRLIQVPSSGPVAWTDSAIQVVDTNDLPVIVPAPTQANTGKVLGVDGDGLYALVAQSGGGSGPDLSDADPQALGAVDPGVSGDASRADHVHPLPAHNSLTDRDAADAHPIGAITGLADALAAAGGSPVSAGFALGLVAVDGTETSFPVLTRSPGATGAGLIPDGFVEQVTLDLATFTGAIGFYFPAGVNVVLPGGPNFGVYFVDPAAVDQPWVPVDWSLVEESDWIGLPGVGKVDTVSVGDLLTVPLAGYGIADKFDQLGAWAQGWEGTLDRWAFVQCVATSNVDLTGLLAANAGWPALDGGDVPTPGGEFSHCWVYLFAQTDPAENGLYVIESDNAGVRKPDPAFFDPPGNGYRIRVSNPGSTLDGQEFTWLDDDPSHNQRGTQAHSDGVGLDDGAGHLTGRWCKEPAPAGVFYPTTTPTP